MYNNFTKGISASRLEAYRHQGGSDLDMIAMCLWNTALSESLYPSLQYLEIGLRNSINDALSFVYRDPFWFINSFVCERCYEDVSNAKIELEKRGKPLDDPNRIIAELSFGFWTRLFGKHYQQSLWNNKTFLLRAFPNATPQQRTRTALAVKIDSIRQFRNRIFHHERIIGHDLAKYHSDIVLILGWINVDLVNASKLLDRFTLTNSKKFEEELRVKLLDLIN